MIKDEILDAFDALGFKMEPIDDFGYGFDYEGSNYLYLPSDNDEDFVNVCIPGIYELEEGEDMLYYKLVDKINSSMKYVKSYKYGGRVWLFYERELIGGEDLMMLLSHMILSLEASYNFARKAMAELKASDDGDEAADTLEADGGDESDDNAETNGNDGGIEL